MKKRFRFTLVILLFSNCLFSQPDSIKSEILANEDSKSTIISRGRRLLLDKFMEGDLTKVREIKDYLIKTEDKDYLAFYPAEYWLVLYWTRDYTELAEVIRETDSQKFDAYKTKIKPPNDMLYAKLKDRSLDNEKQLKKQIERSGLDAETRQILLLTFDHLLIEDGNKASAQDSINEKADRFLRTYPSGRFADFTKNYIRYKLVPKNWGWAFEIFSGYGIYNGNLRDGYTNSVPFGVDVDICYKKLELYLRTYIGFNNTRKDYTFSLGTWEKGSGAEIIIPEASLGYAVYNDKRFKISPFAGIGGMYIGPTEKDMEEKPELKDLYLESGAFIAGINLDIKFGSKHRPAYSPKTSYTFLRIRYGYNKPGFEKKYDGMTGDMHYITIGLGGMLRGLKRQY